MFTVLNSFGGRLPISTWFRCFSGNLSYPFIWNIIFLFILSSLLVLEELLEVVLEADGIVFLISSVCCLVDEDKRLVQASNERDWLWGKLCLVLVDRVKWGKSLSRVQLFAPPWAVAYQAPPSMGLSRQEYWSGLPFPSPEDLPDPGIEPGSPAFPANTLTSEPPGKPRET